MCWRVGEWELRSEVGWGKLWEVEEGRDAGSLRSGGNLKDQNLEECEGTAWREIKT